MKNTEEGAYVAPSAEEVRDILSRMELTGDEAGGLVGCQSRQIRRYTGGDSKMPFAILFTLAVRHSDCQVSPGNWRNELVIAPKSGNRIKGMKF